VSSGTSFQFISSGLYFYSNSIFNAQNSFSSLSSTTFDGNSICMGPVTFGGSVYFLTNSSIKTTTPITVTGSLTYNSLQLINTSSITISTSAYFTFGNLTNFLITYPFGILKNNLKS
jgi:hypothetical protein